MKDENCKVKIELNQKVGQSKVFIDSEEVGGVHDVSINMSVGALPTVTLTLLPADVEITGFADIVRHYATLQPPPFTLGSQEQV